MLSKSGGNLLVGAVFLLLPGEVSGFVVRITQSDIASILTNGVSERSFPNKLN